MKCKNCNCELEANSLFCPYCGTEQVKENSDKAKVVKDKKSDDSINNDITNDITNNISKSSVGNGIGNVSHGKSSIGKEKKRMKPIFIVLIVLGGVQVLLVMAVAIIVALYSILGSGESLSFDSIFGGGNEDVVIDHDYDHIYNDSYFDTEPSYYDDTESVIEETEPMTEQTEPTVEDTTAAPDTRPAETTGKPVWEGSSRVVIANGGLNMRSGPGLSESVVNLIPNGNIITVEKVENNWAYVYYGGGYGWCSCDYLFVPIQYTGTLLYTATVRCNGNIEMISYDYAEDDEIFTDVPNGTTVYVYEIEGDRAFIKYNNIYGWCPGEYLDLH